MPSTRTGRATTAEHCDTCTCRPPDVDDVAIYPPNEKLWGRCTTCDTERWGSERTPFHRSTQQATHCACCTHQHDLEAGGYLLPAQGVSGDG